MIRVDKWIKKEECSFPSTNILSAGRAGFEPAVEVFPRQPLSRRPQSTTLAPPLLSCYSISKLSGLYNLQTAFLNLSSQGGGRGIRTPGGREPTAVFKTAALVHSAIPPGCGG